MRLFKRDNSDNWQYEIKGQHGKIRKSTGTSLKREARKIAEYHQQKVYNQIFFGAKSTLTTHQAVDRFLNEQSKHTENTYQFYKHMTGAILKLLGANKPFETITSLDLIKIQATSRYAPKTLNHICSTLNKMRICSEEWNVQMPVFKYKKLKTISKLRFLTKDEEKLLLDSLETQDQYDICVILLDTGMRISECVNLLNSDVNIKESIITIYRSKTSNMGIVGITDRMRDVLERRLGDAKSVYLFPSPKDISKPRTRTTKSIRRAIRAAGLNAPEMVSRYGTCTVHSLRDTFATRLVQAGVSLYKVQVILGHSSPTMTQKYAHLESGDICNEISNILNKQL